MAEKNKKGNQVNIYELAGEFGKNIKKYGGYVFASVVTLAIAKGPDLIKKIKK